MKTKSQLIVAAFVLFAILEVALVVNAWGEKKFGSWMPVLIMAAMIVALVVGARLKVGKDGFELDTTRRQEAVEELRKATQSRGLRGSNAAAAEERILRINRGRVRDVLWVDDHPENNVHEIRMMLPLGFRVTTALSTDDALAYLRSLPFDLIITDLGRAENLEAGIDLIQLVGKMSVGSRPPIVVYTLQEDSRARRALESGAKYVATMPGALLEHVLESTRS